jgi:hypothetical protein
MPLTIEPPVAKAGRPRKQKPEPPTRHVRVKPDLAEMIAVICRHTNTQSAELLDPILRPQIAARYAMLKPLIDAIQAAEEKAMESKKKKG